MHGSSGISHERYPRSLLALVAGLGCLCATGSVFASPSSRGDSRQVSGAADRAESVGDVALMAGEESGYVELPESVVVGDAPAVSESVGEPMSLMPPQVGRPGSAASCTKWIVGADYLSLRPTFSHSTAMLANIRTGGLTSGTLPVSSALDSIDYNFGYSSGVRAFLGYQATPDSVFRFTYMNYYGISTVVGNARGNWAGGDGTIVIGPYNTGADAPGESIASTAEVGMNVYDIEWARRLDVEGGCGSPMWDVAAGAGIRFLDSRVSSNVFNSVITVGFPDLLVTTNRTFGGVGPRLAGQVRRYIGPNRRWSGFGAIGGALLVGSVSNTSTRLTLDLDRTFEQQSIGGSIVVPNVDISLGGTWQVRPRTSISAGWMLMYFGNLGYSEQVTTAATVPGTAVTSVPLANSSLSLNGFFIRLSHAF